MYNTHVISSIDSLDVDSVGPKQGKGNHHDRNPLISLFPLSPRKKNFPVENFCPRSSPGNSERPLLCRWHSVGNRILSMSCWSHIPLTSPWPRSSGGRHTNQPRLFSVLWKMQQLGPIRIPFDLFSCMHNNSRAFLSNLKYNFYIFYAPNYLFLYAHMHTEPNFCLSQRPHMHDGPDQFRGQFQC